MVLLYFYNDNLYSFIKNNSKKILYFSQLFDSYYHDDNFVDIYEQDVTVTVVAIKHSQNND